MAHQLRSPPQLLGRIRGSAGVPSIFTGKSEECCACELALPWSRSRMPAHSVPRATPLTASFVIALQSYGTRKTDLRPQSHGHDCQALVGEARGVAFRAAAGDLTSTPRSSVAVLLKLVGGVMRYSEFDAFCVQPRCLVSSITSRQELAPSCHQRNFSLTQDVRCT